MTTVDERIIVSFLFFRSTFFNITRVYHRNMNLSYSTDEKKEKKEEQSILSFTRFRSPLFFLTLNEHFVE